MISAGKDVKQKYNFSCILELKAEDRSIEFNLISRSIEFKTEQTEIQKCKNELTLDVTYLCYR